MPTYTVEMTRAAHRVYKKLDPPVQRRVKAEMAKVVEAPTAAPQLRGLPLPVRSHHFSHQGVQWRIAYTVNDDAAKVVVVLLGVRENFYDRLKRVL
jgi:mRNA-degrading endonuclease RelE of RelBE toxin-antitoxin system